MRIAQSKKLAAEPSDRRMEILSAAAQQFALKGYAATSMRDIAAVAGLLAGSIYHHFASKDDMVLEAYKAGVERVIAAHDLAIANVSDPWDRLEAACVAHLECLLADDALARLLPLDLRQVPTELRRKLVLERDRYERRFLTSVKGVAVAHESDERFARMMLLGALNWTTTWYKRGGEAPRKIASAFVRLLRGGFATRR